MSFRGTLAAVTVLALVGCAGKTPTGSEHLVAATLWQKTSGENRALAYQAFRLAREVFDRDLRTNRSKGKRAVVVDIDETILDNNPYQSGAIVDGTAFPTGWADWVNRAEAAPIAGSVEFLRYAHGKGARIFYVTNREDSQKAATLANLKKAGFPDVSDETLLCRTTENNKEARRRRIEKDYRIVLLAGDNLNDFTDAFEGKTVEERFAAVERFKNEFGSRYIVLPNPVYGDWEGALYQYRWTLPSAEKALLRHRLLRIEKGL